MVHAIMARNMSLNGMPGWFLEGTAEFIQGADERVRNDLILINTQSSFEAAFKTTAGSPSNSEGYSVSYVAVKFLDNEIRKNGGNGIQELFDQLKTGKTLDQSLIAVSLAHNGMNGAWSSLASFETYFKSVGLASIYSLLDLNNTDTGSIAGSDYGNAVLDAKAVIPDTNSGAPKHFNLVIPSEYIAVGDVHNEIESIKFANGDAWDVTRIKQETSKNIVIGNNSDETLTGSYSSDTFIGNKGNDKLIGLSGDDIYKYKKAWTGLGLYEF